MSVIGGYFAFSSLKDGNEKGGQNINPLITLYFDLDF